MKRSFVLVSVLHSSLSHWEEHSPTRLHFRAAVGVRTASGKISALVQFLAEFPGSPFRGGAYNSLFGLYVERWDEADALDAAAATTCRRWRRRRGWVPTTSSRMRLQ